MGKSLVIAIVLILLLVAGGYYFLYNPLSESRSQKELSMQIEFTSAGYERAVSDLFRELTKCKPIPVTYKDVSVTIIAMECLGQTEK